MFCPSADCWKKYLTQGPESQAGKEIIYNDLCHPMMKKYKI